MGIERRKIWITGASSGIGEATARRFAAEGCDVCLNALDEARLGRVLDGLPNGDHLVCPGDYSDPATAESTRRAIAERWGRLDVLVSCAGIYRSVPAVGSDLRQWRQCLDVMTAGAVHVSRAAAELMTGGGRIVHVTSVHARRVEKGGSSYAMAKAAVEALCRGLALELAERNILVNAIAPGFVDTPMCVVDGVNELESDWFKRNYVEGHHLPLKRAASPEEIAGVAWFLAGSDASYITGQTITVDGGLTITF